MAQHADDESFQSLKTPIADITTTCKALSHNGSMVSTIPPYETVHKTREVPMYKPIEDIPVSGAIFLFWHPQIHYDI